MDGIISIKAVKKKMNPSLAPKDYRLYNFFMGMPEQLTEEEIKEMKRVAIIEHRKFISFLNKAKTA